MELWSSREELCYHSAGGLISPILASSGPSSFEKGKCVRKSGAFLTTDGGSCPRTPRFAKRAGHQTITPDFQSPKTGHGDKLHEMNPAWDAPESSQSPKTGHGDKLPSLLVMSLILIESQSPKTGHGDKRPPAYQGRSSYPPRLNPLKRGMGINNPSVVYPGDVLMSQSPKTGHGDKQGRYSFGTTIVIGLNPLKRGMGIN